MKRWLAIVALGVCPVSQGDETVAGVLAEAQAAEARLDSGQALALYLHAEQVRPGDAGILQKIARQYSDLVLDQSNDPGRKRCAQAALEYAQRAVALNPRDPVNVLSLAVAHGKLAVYSDTKDKLRYSRLVKEEAEQALSLDPDYAWAHHVLGRWHCEVASLGVTSRWAVSLVYGGLPAASFGEAIAHLRRAVQLEPQEVTHHLELGFALAAVGRSAEARQVWVSGLQLPSRGKHDEPAKQRAREALAGLDQRALPAVPANRGEGKSQAPTSKQVPGGKLEAGN